MIGDRPSNISTRSPVELRTEAAPRKPAAPPKPDAEDTPQVSEAKVQVETAPPATVSQQDESEAAAAQELAKQRRDEVKQRVNEAIPKVRELMQKNQRALDFKVAEEENRVIITVIDKETDKVIRQIPPEDLIQIAQSIDQGLNPLQSGSILNSKA